jgi:hypothetical protein
LILRLHLLTRTEGTFSIWSPRSGTETRRIDSSTVLCGAAFYPLPRLDSQYISGVVYTSKLRFYSRAWLWHYYAHQSIDFLASRHVRRHTPPQPPPGAARGQGRCRFREHPAGGASTRSSTLRGVQEQAAEARRPSSPLSPHRRRHVQGRRPESVCTVCVVLTPFLFNYNLKITVTSKKKEGAGDIDDDEK